MSKIDISEMTIGQLKEIGSLLAQQPENTPNNRPTAFVVGKCYFIRTVTYHSVGRLLAIFPEELVLEDASWVADSGRFHTALKTGQLDEVEPFIDAAIIARGGIIDATVWSHDLPKVQK